jgi:hypothetical protein
MSTTALLDGRDADLEFVARESHVAAVRRASNDSLLRLAVLRSFVGEFDERTAGDVRAITHFLATTRDQNDRLLMAGPREILHVRLLESKNPREVELAGSPELARILARVDLEVTGSFSGYDYNERIEQKYFEKPISRIRDHIGRDFEFYMGALEIARPSQYQQRFQHFARLLSAYISLREGDVPDIFSGLSRRLAIQEIRAAILDLRFVPLEELMEFIFEHPLGQV